MIRCDVGGLLTKPSHYDGQLGGWSAVWRQRSVYYRFSQFRFPFSGDELVAPRFDIRYVEHRPIGSGRDNVAEARMSLRLCVCSYRVSAVDAVASTQ